MVIQESINVIEKYTIPNIGLGKIVIEAHNMAKSALEKQIPQILKGEPCHVKAFDGKYKVYTYECYPCPNCTKFVTVSETHKYCEYCGLALDWSEENEKIN